ncbi:heavy-metal-associated domain-containing protein [Halobacillus amylolyticus]|uniref:Cation transporter n=1 Tax=Halobacillus amylolyticus TaxID=2932259 RepID=A0ABY4HA64_9BACI|nr:heavy-metal-associated domain-containing protein [Halobacillus amylolyticus]UOR11754.1 cation transporter [Halobacillus amylolyticus]
MKTATFFIKGMNDDSDVSKVSHALHDVWGIRKAEVSLNLNKATLSYDEAASSLEDFEQAIMDSGFEAEMDNREGGVHG